jgi:hypothetical protein
VVGSEDLRRFNVLLAVFEMFISLDEDFVWFYYQAWIVVLSSPDSDAIKLG